MDSKKVLITGASGGIGKSLCEKFINANYKIICSGIPYILTIFEKRVEEQDLPFFMDLKLYLINNNFEFILVIKYTIYI